MVPLSEYRKSLGLTLAQTASELGLSDKSVGWLSEIENGKRDASLRLALRIERWSVGKVSASSVNAEIRAGQVSGDGPDLQGGGSSVDDAAVVAPGPTCGADKSVAVFSPAEDVA